MRTPDPLRRKIGDLRSRLRRLFAIDGVSRLVGAVALAFALAVLVDWTMVLPSAGRLACLVVLGVLAAFILVRYLAMPLLLKLGDEDLALSVEKRFPELKDRLISTVEFTRENVDKAHFGSPVLVDAVIEETRQFTKELDFRRGLKTKRLRRLAGAASLVALLLLLALIFLPEARLASERILMPFADLRYPQRTILVSVSPGDARVPKGEDLTVSAKFERWIPTRAWVEFKTGLQGWETRRMVQGPGGEYSVSFRAISDNMTYRIRGGDAASREYLASVVERIRLWDKTITYKYRPYTRIKPKVQEGAGGQLRAPVGTAVHVKAVANKPIVSLSFMLNGKPSDLIRRVGPRTVEGDFVLAKPGPKEPSSYAIRVTDADGLTNQGEETCALDVEEDRPPSVRIDEPQERNAVVTAAAVVPLKISFEDNFGLQDGNLEYRLIREAKPGSPDRKVLFKTKVEFGEPANVTTADWDLADLKLQPGDSVSYRAIARDFCDVPAPNVGTSEEYSLRVVSPEDYLSEIQRRTRELVTGELERVSDLQGKNAASTEDVRRNFEQAKTLSSDDLTKLLTDEMSQKQITSRATNVATAAASLRRDLLNNRLGDSPLAKQLKASGEKLNSLAADLMPAAEGDVNKARMSPDAGRLEKLDKAIETQREVKKELDRIVGDLKQSQGLNELRSRAQVLLRKQQELNKGTLGVYRDVFGREPSAAEKETLNKQGVDQRDLKNRVAELLDDILKSAAKTAAGAPEESKILAKAHSDAKDANIEGAMLGAAENLSRALLGRATEDQDKAERGLKELVKNLGENAEQDRAQKELQEKLAAVDKALEQALAKEKNILDSTQGATGLKGMLDRIAKALAQVGALKAGQQSAASGTAEAAKQPDPAAKGSLDKLSKDQRDLEKKTGDVGKDVGDINKSAPTIAPQPAKDALADAQKSLNDAGAKMGQAASKMEQDAKGGQPSDSKGGKSGEPSPSQAGQQASGSQGEASKKLDDAQKKLTDAQKAVEDALKRELDRLHKEQEENRKLAEKIARELEKLNKENPSQQMANAGKKTDQAGQNMQDARDKLDQKGGQSGQSGQSGQGGKSQGGNPQQAQEDEKKAIDNLKQAQRDVKKQQDDFAQKDQDEKLLEIESELRAMLDVQLGVNKTTDELDKIASGGKELGRKEKLDLDKITGDEKGVSEKSSEIQKKLDEEKIPVYAWVMADVSKDTNAVTSMLSRSDTGPVTKQVEANVVANLKDLIDALQRQRMQNQKAGGGGGGGGGGGKSRLVPPLAEVKMIKAMHQRASRQTHELDEMIRSGKVKGDDAKARVGELAGKESQIGKLLQDLLDALTAPPDEPKDK